MLLVAERFPPVVARVVTNAKRCLPWSNLFPFPEDGLIYDLSQWDLFSQTTRVKERKVCLCMHVCVRACVRAGVTSGPAHATAYVVQLTVYVVYWWWPNA